MVTVITDGVFLVHGKTVLFKNDPRCAAMDSRAARQGTIAYRVLAAHNQSGSMEKLKIRFDALASHDITYVSIIQTARASGLQEFPVPYVLTNCHNSLCAVGGTISQDDHLFGLSAAKKYGGIYVPAHLAVIHQYVREMVARCGGMVLGSDSHTRYGALGTMGIGEGGPELVKQLLGKTYDLDYPEIVAVFLHGEPRRGVGPQDVALAIIGAVFHSGFATNKVLEFVGPGLEKLSVDYRNGIDVMTTETTCLSSIWATDEKVEQYYRVHGRADGYLNMQPAEVAYYDGLVEVDLTKIEPMIALPFHPSNVFTIAELNQNTFDILRMVEEEGKKQLDGAPVEFSLTTKIVNNRLKVEQGIVAGCAGGTFENLNTIAAMVGGRSIGSGRPPLSVYPASQPVYAELIRNGAALKMITAGITLKTAFCGPCFGSGDVPAHDTVSIRHTTRNFPNREGSKLTEGQIAAVALMDARSITATILNGGLLTPATEVEIPETPAQYMFNRAIYDNRVYDGFGKPRPETDLRFGPNIADWPPMPPLPEHLLLQVASVILDPVTTTDELIPSGETSSYRSNPLKLAEYTLSRRDPHYLGRAKKIAALEAERASAAACLAGGERPAIAAELRDLAEQVLHRADGTFAGIADFLHATGIGSVICARKPGDGSAREQAASCQKVLGGWANIALEYATKRYRSNLINWGLLPFTVDRLDFEVGDIIFIPGIREHLIHGREVVTALVIRGKDTRQVVLGLKNLTAEEREVILCGNLMNYYAWK